MIHTVTNQVWIFTPSSLPSSEVVKESSWQVVIEFGWCRISSVVMYKFYFWKFSQFLKKWGVPRRGDRCWKERVGLEFGAYFIKIEHMWESRYKILICISINANPVNQYHYINMRYWKYMAEYKTYKYQWRHGWLSKGCVDEYRGYCIALNMWMKGTNIWMHIQLHTYLYIGF